LLAEKKVVAELTGLVMRELDRINNILTQMLRLAAPKPAVFTTLRAHELLDRSLRLLQHPMGAKTIFLRKHYHAQPDAVCGDDAQLQQALMNLLLNAIEAMDPDGVLTVSTELAAGGHGAGVLKVHIQDTGAGIAPENLARLFEPFFTTKPNGTGLGLAISRRIALEHQGTIEVRSEIARGSTFTLTLPAAEAS